jgi:hypothetical protein
MAEDREVPFRLAERSAPAPAAARIAGTGGTVIDLTALREELEALRGQQTAG